MRGAFWCCSQTPNRTGVEETTIGEPIWHGSATERQGEQEIHLAARRGDVDLVSELIKGGVSVNVASKPRDGQGFTPLVLACRAGHIEVVKRLLEDENLLTERQGGGLDLGVRFSSITSSTPLERTDDMTPFLWAVWEGHLEVAGLMARDPRVNTTDLPPLHEAALTGKIHEVRSVLKGMTAEKRELQRTVVGPLPPFGHMPAVFLAAEMSHGEIARLLLTEGYGLPENIVDAMLTAVEPGAALTDDEGFQRQTSIDETPIPAERVYRMLMAAFKAGAASSLGTATAICAVLVPWLASMASQRYLFQRPGRLERLQAVCEKQGDVLLAAMDGEVMVHILEQLGRIVYPLNSARSRTTPRQDDVGPLASISQRGVGKKAAKDASNGKMSSADELVYCAVLALTGAALDSLFNRDLEELLDNLPVNSLHFTQPKSFRRMHHRLRNVKDHGDPNLRKPRSAANLDVLRASVVASSPEDVEKSLEVIGSKYPVLQVQNSFDTAGFPKGHCGTRSIVVNFLYNSELTLSEVFGDTGRAPEPQELHFVDSGSQELRLWQAEELRGQVWLMYANSQPQADEFRQGLAALWQEARQEAQGPLQVVAEIRIFYAPYFRSWPLPLLLSKLVHCRIDNENEDVVAREFSHLTMSLEDLEARQELTPVKLTTRQRVGERQRWNVQIRRTGRLLGMQLDFGKGEVPVVKQILYQGPILEYNSHETTEEKFKITPGDAIIEVNGARQRKKLMNRLKSDKILNLVFERHVLVDDKASVGKRYSAKQLAFGAAGREWDI